MKNTNNIKKKSRIQFWNESVNEIDLDPEEGELDIKDQEEEKFII